MPTSSGLVVSRTAIPTLTRWGVTPEADLVYRALVEFGPQILGDLSRSLGLASARVRVALDELAEVDAARPGLRPGRVRRPDQARQWAAAAPERATAVLRARHLAALVLS